MKNTLWPLRYFICFSCKVDHTARAKFSTNLVCQRDSPKSVRAHRSVRSRPEVTTKQPSVHVQTSGGRSRPPFKFVRAQSSRPNPPSVHARPRPSLRPTASISGHRSGSFTTRGHDQTRPAFASVRVVRSRPPFAFIHDQRSRPNTTSVHDQTSFPSSAPRPPAASVHTTRSHVWSKHLKEGPFALRGCSVCEGVGGFCSAACSSQHTPRVHE